MKAVVDRIVQYANRYQLTNVETGEVLGTFDFEEVTGTVQQVGTEIDKELFDSIANDLAARVKLSGGELAETIVTFPDISDTAANVASGDTSATLWGKVKNWFSRLKALAFKNKVAAGDFEAGAIKNADVAADAAIAQSKVSGLMTDYVASIGVSGRTVTYKNKNGVNMGSITTQDTTYGLASQSSNGLMSSTDKTKLDGIESGAQKNTVLGVKGGSEGAYRTGNVNITKANIGLGNVDNTADTDKPVSTATKTALNGKANTSGTYPNLTVGKATADADGNVINKTYAKLSQVVRVDAAQSLTDAQKNTVAQNIERSAGRTVNSGGVGWYNILTADINGYFVADLSVTSTYSRLEPTEVKIIAIGGYAIPGLTTTRASITCFSSGALSSSISKVRVRSLEGQICIDVYIPVNTTLYFNNMNVTLNSWKNIDNIMPQVQAFTFVGTEEPAADNVSICEVIQNGISTNGQIYQQGSPVLVGDQSAIFESDGTTVKNATNAKKVNGKNLYCHELKFTLADGLGAGYKGRTFVFYGQILSSSNEQVENSIKLYSLFQAAGVSRIKVEGLYDETIENGGFYRSYVNGAITAQSADSIKFIGLATSYLNSSSSYIYPRIAEIDVGSMTIEDIVTQIL